MTFAALPTHDNIGIFLSILNLFKNFSFSASSTLFCQKFISIGTGATSTLLGFIFKILVYFFFSFVFTTLNLSAFFKVKCAILLNKLKAKIDKTGSINISSQKYRSQLKNKKAAEKKLLNILEKALKVKKIRIPVKLSREIIEKRLKNKRIKSDIKKFRQKHNIRFE